MKKYESWMTTLFSLVFIAVPSIVGIFFLIGQDPNYGLVFGAAFGILVGGNLLAYLGYRFHLLAFDALRFVAPLTVVFFGIYATMYQHWWVMLILALVGVLSSFPINMLLTRLREIQIRRKVNKTKIEKN